MAGLRKLLFLACVVHLAGTASAQNLRLELVNDEIVKVAFAASTPADPQAFYVGEHHSGKIWRLDLCSGQKTLFFTQLGLVTSYSKGLCGMAFHPDYENNGKFYLSFLTAPVTTGYNSATRIWEYTVDGNGVPGSPRQIIVWDQQNQQHNSTFVLFGPDGMLYIGSGDGGNQKGGTAPNNDSPPGVGNRSQSMNGLYGKILRIDVDHQDSGLEYHIPDGTYGEVANSYVGATDSFGNTARGEFWVYGLRSPWRASFDRQTGDFYIGDVGQTAWEWINFVPADTGGQNFGWCQYEGGSSHPTDGDAAMTHCVLETTTPYTEPIYAYAHSGTLNCVIGGYVYRGSAIPGLQGTYFFGDNEDGQIFSFRYTSGGGLTDFQDRNPELTTPDLSSFAEDESGELYLLEYGDNNTGDRGRIYKLVEDIPRDPVVNNNVDYEGYATFASWWLTDQTGVPADFDDDCQVGLTDLGILAGFWLANPTPPGTSTLQIQENQAGFGAVSGGSTIDSDWAGYTGSGFVNTNNAVGAYIEWSVNSPAGGDYQLQWRFANGSSSRPGAVRVNGGIVASNVDFPATGAWDSWDVTVLVNVTLVAGNNTVRLEAEDAGGLANIDWIEITGDSPTPGI